MNFVNTPLLRIAYEQWNASGQTSVILMHGWPDSTRCWHRVAPRLAAAGFRVLAPSLRGFGQTQFLKSETPRSGQLAALGRDLLDFIDALQIKNPILIGHDWGARAVAIACGLRPGVASHLVMLSVGYGTNSPDQALSIEQARNYWYHWFMATPRGVKFLREERRAFCRKMWDSWSPGGWFNEEEFEATAKDFDNPDWADLVISSYTHRWGHSQGDPAYDQDEACLDPAPSLDVPTLVLHGGADGVNPSSSSAGKEAFFKASYERKVLPGIGHFPQREAPDEVFREVMEFLQKHTAAAPT